MFSRLRKAGVAVVRPVWLKFCSLSVRRRIAAVLILVILVPYIASRIRSQWRCITHIRNTNAPVARLESSAARTLRVLTFNIAHVRGQAQWNWNGGDRDERRRRRHQFASVLRRANADIVILNEVDFISFWSHTVNQAEELVSLGDFREYIEQRNYDVRFPFLSMKFGNAILSKYRLSEPQLIDLPSHAWWETLLAGKKKGVAVEVDVHGEQVLLIAVHLDPRSEDVRIRSGREILNVVRSSKVPVIVAGDLNSSPPDFPRSTPTEDGRTVVTELTQTDLLNRYPSGPLQSEYFTFPAEAPDRVLDWILISPELEFADYRILETAISDHRPVLAEIRLPQPDATPDTRPPTRKR